MKTSANTAIEVVAGVGDHERKTEEDQRHDGDRPDLDPAAHRSTGRLRRRLGSGRARRLAAHWARTADRPNRPCGRIDRTSTSAAK